MSTTKRYIPYPHTHMTDNQWADIAKLQQYPTREDAERALGKQLDEIEDMMGADFDEPAAVGTLCSYILSGDDDTCLDFEAAFNNWTEYWFHDG